MVSGDTRPDDTRSIATVYEDIWSVEAVEEWLLAAESLAPRAPASLFNLLDTLTLTQEALILDAGCGQGHHSIALAQRFGASVVALDPVESNLAVARQHVAEAGLTALVRVQPGTLEALPFADGYFDLVWCRGVIPHLSSVAVALGECRRVLRPGGHLVIHTGYAGPLLAAAEATALYQRMGFVAASMERTKVEAAIAKAGFTIVQSDSLSSEYAEYYEEHGGRCARYLLALAKLLRAEETVVARFGRQAYETTLGVFHWQLYQLLGKIHYHAYLLQMPSAQ
jgi:ubiquinone/menaquinone biosynthesis C-methylase UbiE